VADRHRHVVLLVDDDTDAREALAELLRLDGYVVREASDGSTALGLLRRAPLPCVVLLDLSMPGISGWRFRALQLQDRRIATVPVIALSGHGGIAQQSSRLRLAGYVAKPPDLDKLLATVRQTCQLAA